jgi:hypothetical protein
MNKCYKRAVVKNLCQLQLHRLRKHEYKIVSATINHYEKVMKLLILPRYFHENYFHFPVSRQVVAV